MGHADAPTGVILHIHFKSGNRESIEAFCPMHGAAKRQHKGRSGLTLAIAVKATLLELALQGCGHKITGVVDYIPDRDRLLELFPADDDLYHGIGGSLRTIEDCDVCDPEYQLVRETVESEYPMLVILHDCPTGMQMMDFREPGDAKVN